MEVGSVIEDFELPDQAGVPRRLSEFCRIGPVVVFFYPAAMTTGCTAESCHFRDLSREFSELGASRVGISRDPVDKQARFAAAHGFDFPLLSDETGEVAARFGVRRDFSPLPVRRRTFVIGEDLRLLGVVKSEIRMQLHADRALEILRARRG